MKIITFIYLRGFKWKYLYFYDFNKYISTPCSWGICIWPSPSFSPSFWPNTTDKVDKHKCIITFVSLVYILNIALKNMKLKKLFWLKSPSLWRKGRVSTVWTLWKEWCIQYWQDGLYIKCTGAFVKSSVLYHYTSLNGHPPPAPKTKSNNDNKS